jgi:hypothetical protein
LLALFEMRRMSTIDRLFWQHLSGFISSTPEGGTAPARELSLREGMAVLHVRLG